MLLSIYLMYGWQMDSVINPSLGPQERVDSQYPVRTLLTEEGGAHVSFGSDWPVDNIVDPLLGLEMAVTHVAPHSGVRGSLSKCIHHNRYLYT